VKRGTAFVEFWGDANAGWYDAKSGPVTAKVAGENLFAIEKSTGARAWVREGGLVLHATVAAAAGRIHLVEARSPAALAGESRRLGPADIEKDLHLVALDAATGRPLWERPLMTGPAEVALSLATDGEIIVIVASGAGRYTIGAFGAERGEPRWEAVRRWTGDNHGAHMSRPAVAGGAVYVRPAVLDRVTGEPVGIEMPPGGCGTYAVAGRALVYRAGTVTMWDPRGRTATSWSRLRPDCWLSTIPAEGLILSPEGGGGCSCGSWMETSIAFAPAGGLK
jgi:outer membrane protein assembly factor BamB